MKTYVFWEIYITSATQKTWERESTSMTRALQPADVLENLQHIARTVCRKLRMNFCNVLLLLLLLLRTLYVRTFHVTPAYVTQISLSHIPRPTLVFPTPSECSDPSTALDLCKAAQDTEQRAASLSRPAPSPSPDFVTLDGPIPAGMWAGPLARCTPLTGIDPHIDTVMQL